MIENDRGELTVFGCWILIVIVVCLICLMLSGCAKKPVTVPVGGDACKNAISRVYVPPGCASVAIPNGTKVICPGHTEIYTCAGSEKK